METPTPSWLIFETSERDFLLWGDNIKVEIQKRPEADEIIYEYNQDEIGAYSCTLHGALWAVSDLMNYWYSKEERKTLWAKALELGASETEGWHFYKAIDLVRKEWNAKWKEQLISFRLPYGEIFFEAVNRGHSLVGGYRGNSQYNLDASDWTLMWTDFKPSTYGHCIRIRKTWENVSVIDNYLGKKKTNKYIVEHLDDLITNKVFYDEFYIFLPKNTMTPEQIEALEAKKQWIWNGNSPDSPATRQEVAIMINRAMKLWEKK